jgi:hypothetical protein
MFFEHRPQNQACKRGLLEVVDIPAPLDGFSVVFASGANRKALHYAITRLILLAAKTWIILGLVLTPGATHHLLTRIVYVPISPVS